MTAPDSRDSVERIALEMKAHRVMGSRIAELDDWADRLQALARGPQQAGGEDHSPEEIASVVSDLRTLAKDGWIVADIAANLIEKLHPLQAEVARLREILWGYGDARGTVWYEKYRQLGVDAGKLLDRAIRAEAALREESARLDWLIENRHLFTSCNGQWFAVIGPAEIAQRDAARAAIDAALNRGQDDA